MRKEEEGESGGEECLAEGRVEKGNEGIRGKRKGNK